MECIFCSKPLDNSDEHIILDSLNGKLHSKEIICSECNNFFGSKLDSVAKNFFNPVLLVFGFKNASGVMIENLKSEQKFLLQKDLSIKQIKLDIKELIVKGKRLLTVSGNAKDAINYFNKHSKRLHGKGIKSLKESKEYVVKRPGPMRFKVDFKTSEKMDLLLNKIAFEFLHYNKIENVETGELKGKIRNLETPFSNVTYCNLDEDIRKFDDREISHLLILKNFNNNLIVYIELFNVVCAVVIISENYNDKDIEIFYYQDAVTGEKFDSLPQINDAEIERLLQSKMQTEIEVTPLVNKLFYRKREREFRSIIDTELDALSKRLGAELDTGVISKKEFKDKYIDESTSFLARLSIDFPYMLDDVDDVNNDDLNYLHSNMRENQYDDFYQKFKNLKGKTVKIDNNRFFKIEDFVKVPIASQNGITVCKVDVVLFDGIETMYIPYGEFFDRIGIARN